jgi:hypothetical protein
MNRKLMVLSLSLALAATACSSTVVNLPYQGSPVGQAAAANPVVEMGTVVDQRKNPPHSLGAIRNGFGGALKSLDTGPPVSDVIKTAFEQGLKARGLAAPAGAGRYRIDLRVLKFDCSQYVRREAHAQIELALIGPDGKVEYTHEIVANEVQGSLLALDTAVFASVEDLRKVANDLLQKTVDEALDDPGLLAHFSGPATSS